MQVKNVHFVDGNIYRQLIHSDECFVSVALEPVGQFGAIGRQLILASWLKQLNSVICPHAITP